MCLYTKYINNPKYMPNKKNNYNPPICKDKRVFLVPTKCGKCIECRKQKQREWCVRLAEEIRNNKSGIFVTLTINNKSFWELSEKAKSTDENEIMTKAMRLFLERIRKETKKSVKHWAITELGENTERIHLHGIFFCKKELIEKHWKYGFTFIGEYVNEKTILYITKYMLKTPEKSPNFIGKVLCSKGIGANYLNRPDAKRNKYKPNDTNEQYRLKSGMMIHLPEYYSRKIYKDEEREKLWIEKQERGYRYIMGEKVDMNNEEDYLRLLEYHRERAKRLYKENPIEWDKEKHLKQLERLKKYRKSVNK